MFQRTYQTDQLNELAFDSFPMFSRIGGSAMGVSHGILMRLDSVVLPMYYVPGELNPRSSVRDGEGNRQGKLIIYPNPANGVVYVDQVGPAARIDRVDFFDGLGRKVHTVIAKPGEQWPLEVLLPAEVSGVVYVIAYSRGMIADSGMLIKQ